jgi:hypothetical protein
MKTSQPIDYPCRVGYENERAIAYIGQERIAGRDLELPTHLVRHRQAPIVRELNPNGHRLPPSIVAPDEANRSSVHMLPRMRHLALAATSPSRRRSR